MCFTAATVGPTTPIVSTACGSGAPPPPQGGAIPDGTYVLESSLEYGSCGAVHEVQTAIAVCKNEWTVEQVYPATEGGTAGLYVYDYVVSQDGGALVQTPLCSSDLSTTPVDVMFTFAAGQLTLYQTTGGVEYVAHYMMK